MSLTWAEIDARWPDAGVMWDTLGAPFEARFEAVANGKLDAIAPICLDGNHFRFAEVDESWIPYCRCLRWDGSEWTPRPNIFLSFGQSNCVGFSAARYMAAGEAHARAALSILSVLSYCTYCHEAGHYREHCTNRAVADCPPRQWLRGSRAQRKRQRAVVNNKRTNQ